MTRYMGTETEYGIATPTHPEVSSIITSTHAVVSYAAMRTGARSRWDYEDEKPLADSRGFDLRRYHTVPIVESDTVGIANVMTANGARYYVDHAHPEYSSPEVSNAWDAMIYDAAGDYVLRQSVEDLNQLWDEQISILKDHDPCPPLKIYKNNVDGKGASYGSHENYQYSRKTDFDAVVQGLLPYFVTRQVVIGAGRVGIGEEGEIDGFQVSQRADYFFQEVSLETTLNRGIVNTRDEPHANAVHFRRLHTIIGDANMSQYSNLLKLGMTKLVIDAIENGESFADLRLADPVAELRNVSRNLTLDHRLQLVDGRALTALEILGEYRSRLRAEDEVDEKVLKIFDEITADLAEDPLKTADRLDWTAKYALLKNYIDRGASWSDAKLKLIDLQYTDIDPAKSLYHALVRKGRMKTLVSDEEIERAVTMPPEDSRAYFRGRLAARFADNVITASWQTVILKYSEGTAKFSTPNVDEYTRKHVGDIVENAADADELVRAMHEAGLEPMYYHTHHEREHINKPHQH
ncbi:proteasome accessory factor PafA2 [Corynebacterium yudongzhengii]|uniref:Proteasome accessory factor PafA2 n=1 Tax=Corynebacterium yudongzhengii TaxID=2080740 RepID=A0A2U1T8G1_9CORY|nr:depupylase/deamidase Dop [Corynebacterium yudongzhengii]AWB81902.1 proteasome accessory factor PafA2 [Corynebacterium yudongzhengii]PWC02294.1 proteasome accessory factor PafA2 [Corynebacterium yudongzhengii]